MIHDIIAIIWSKFWTAVSYDAITPPPYFVIGWTLTKLTQLKRKKKKRFDNFIMLVGVQGSLFHIAAGSHPVQEEAWGSHDSLYSGQIQKLLQCCQKPHQQIPLIITIQKSIVWSIYHLPFRSYRRKGQRSKFWIYRGQTGKNTPIFLAMVSKCWSCKYNSNSE